MTIQEARPDDTCREIINSIRDVSIRIDEIAISVAKAPGGIERRKDTKERMERLLDTRKKLASSLQQMVVKHPKSALSQSCGADLSSLNEFDNGELVDQVMRLLNY